jgi:hypothetical protein
MKFRFIPAIAFFIFALFYSISTLAQLTSKPLAKPRHSLNVHYAFTYAADVELDDDRQQRLPGIGYQYTNKKSWYFGIDFQYGVNKRPDFYLEPLDGNDFYTYRSATIPGGVGYFIRPQFIEDVNVLITSDTIFKTPLSDYPLNTKLFSERYNVFFNVGKKWEKGRSVFEAGLSLQGTFFRSVIPLTYSVFSPIPAIFKDGNFPYYYFDGVSTAIRTVRERFVPGIGLHARYHYTIKPNFWLGIQTLASASEEGFLLQVSPRIVYGL